MTDFDILYEILGDCFWTGVCTGADRSDAAGQVAITVSAKIFELLDLLGFDMVDGQIVHDHQEYADFQGEVT